MSLEKIIDKITQESGSQVNEIVEQAKTQAAAILATARAEAALQVKSRLDQAKRDSEDLLQREKAIAQLELRKNVLAAKRDLINEVYKKVIAKINTLTDKEYALFIKKQLLQAVETGKEEVIFSAQEAGRLGPKFIQEINLELKKNGKPGALTAGPPSKQLDRGFILKQGSVELNYSLEAILIRLREETESRMAEILFKTS
jgi:V/A-type H+-transporting ATPase subunit E